MNSRMTSDEPEPIPARASGYYWILRKSAQEPEISHYGPSEMNDQKLVDGKITGDRIISEYCWDVQTDCGCADHITDGDVTVLSARITMTDLETLKVMLDRAKIEYKERLHPQNTGHSEIQVEKGYARFVTIFEFKDGNLVEMGAYE